MTNVSWRPSVRDMHRVLVCTLVLGVALLVMPFGRAAESAQPFQAYKQEAVAADHELASAAGAAVLKRGGTAADAAAATLLALGVLHPGSSGLGGGGFATYFDAATGKTYFYDFRERAPSAATRDMFKSASPDVSRRGGLATAVPGEAAGIAALLHAHGSETIAFREIASHAIKYAERGVVFSEAMRRFAPSQWLSRDPVMKTWVGRDGSLSDKKVRQRALAKTLRVLAQRGPLAFYRGEVAKELVRANKSHGGLLTLQDLRDYQVRVRKPLTATHFGMQWVTAPPPSAGGYTMHASLAMLERLPKTQRDPSDEAAWSHALAESWKGAFLDRRRYFGDPDFVDVPLKQLCASSRFDQRARRFDPAHAKPPETYELPLNEPKPNVIPGQSHGTSHFCVVDKAGNVAAVTSTINLGFGAGYTGAGVVMNDEMDDFARSVGSVNAFGLVGGARNLPAPGKRPVSTMSPTIIFRDGKPVMCVGAAGGSKIVTATEQVALNVLLRGMSLEDAMRAPRVHHQAAPNAISTEQVAPLAASVRAALIRRGHTLKEAHHNANVHAIVIGDSIDAGADPRKGGAPAGR